MSEWHHSKNRHNSDFRKLLQELIEKSNPHRNLIAKIYEQIQLAINKDFMLFQQK